MKDQGIVNKMLCGQLSPVTMATWCSRDIADQILIMALLTLSLIRHSPTTTTKAFHVLFIGYVGSFELSSDQCHCTKAKHLVEPPQTEIK